MKYNLYGYSQQRAIQIGLDDRDLMILRWFVDYKDTGKMVKKIFEDDVYYWIKYEGIVEAFPIANWKKDTVYRRLKKLAKLGVLNHKTLKQGGIWSYYNLGINYLALIDTTGEVTIVNVEEEEVGNESEGIGNKSEGIGNKSGTKNTSIINSSINNNSINNTTTINNNCGVGDVNSLKEIFDSFTKHNFMLSPAQFDEIQEDVKQYGKNEILEAIKISDDNCKRTYAYFKAVLNNIHTRGIENKTKKDKYKKTESSKIFSEEFLKRAGSEFI